MANISSKNLLHMHVQSKPNRRVKKSSRSSKVMAAAVQASLASILRRFHLHPLDAAVNELNGVQNSLDHFKKFNPSPFFFRNSLDPGLDKKMARSSDNKHIVTGHARSVDSKISRRYNRGMRPRKRRSKSGSDLSNHRKVEQSDDANGPEGYCLSSTTGLGQLSPHLNRISMEYSSPPALYTPCSPLVKANANTPYALARPPILSGPQRSPPVHQWSNWEHAKVEPILATTASLLESRTPLLRSSLNAYPEPVVGNRKRTLSGASHGENSSDSTDSTTSMPNVTTGSRLLDSTNQTTTSNSLDFSSSSNRLRSRSGPGSEASSEISRPTPHVKRRRDIRPRHVNARATSKSLKRRRSFDQLSAPSIHDTTSVPMASPRERRPVQSTQLLSETTDAASSSSQPLPAQRPSSLLGTSLVYYLPDFSSEKMENDRLYGQIPPSRAGQVKSKEEPAPPDQADLATEPDQVFLEHIEVPHWRLKPISVIRQQSLNMDEEADSDTQTTQQSDGRSFRTSLCKRSIVTDLQCPPDVRLSHSLRAVHPSPSSTDYTSSLADSHSSTDVEDTSDAAYVSRHARLEMQEIRRERRSRQRTFEQEMKHRLEQRERETWRKRQQGRLGAMDKFDHDFRTPSTLNLAFNEINPNRINNMF